MYLESSANSCGHDWVLEQFLDRVVTSHDESLMSQWNSASFNLSIACVFVCPYLEVVCEAVSVEIVDDNCFLSLIAVPPFVLRFKISSWIVSSSFMALACAGWAVKPDTFSSSVIDLWSGVQFVSIHTLLQLDVLLDMNESFFDAFLYT